MKHTPALPDPAERIRVDLPAARDAGPELAQLARLDEILQVLFWMDGEGFGSEVAPRDLTVWLNAEPEAIEPLLERLAERGLVARQGERWSLTESGRGEGGRRFADEFAGLTGAGHGECGDPSCDCQTTGDPADCAHHAHRHA